LIRDKDMFLKSKIAEVMKSENPSFEQVKSHALNLKLEKNLQGVSRRKNKAIKVRL